MKKVATFAAGIVGVAAIFGVGIGNAFAATYTTAQVAPHNTSTDCWEVINGKVYNLTAFIALHTGGEAVIIAQCGKDATATFNNGPHPSGTINALKGYLLGDLTTATAPATSATPATAAPSPAITPPSSLTSTTPTASSDIEDEDDMDEQDEVESHDRDNARGERPENERGLSHSENQGRESDDD